MALTTAAVVLITSGGCSSTDTDPDPMTDPGGGTSLVSDPPSTARLVVRTSSSTQGTRGPVFEEGAVPEMRLVSPDGTVIEPTADHRDTAIFRDLATGDYTLTAALRPCAGSCGYLDPPTGECQDTVQVEGATEASVIFVQGQHCTIRH